MILTEFLLARIAEDERLATEYPLNPRYPELWELGLYYEDDTDGRGMAMAITAPSARVLAECEAKRRIVEAHPLSALTETPQCAECGAPDEYPVAWPCEAVRALASIYRDHPDFDPEWATR